MPSQTADEVAPILRLDPSTVHTRARQGRLGFVKEGSRRLFARHQIEAYIADNEVPAQTKQHPARPTQYGLQQRRS